MPVYGKEFRAISGSVFDVQPTIVACAVIVPDQVPDYATSDSIYRCACSIRAIKWANPVHSTMSKTMVVKIEWRIEVEIGMGDKISGSGRNRCGPSSIREASRRYIVTANRT